MSNSFLKALQELFPIGQPYATNGDDEFIWKKTQDGKCRQLTLYIFPGKDDSFCGMTLIEGNRIEMRVHPQMEHFEIAMKWLQHNPNITFERNKIRLHDAVFDLHLEPNEARYATANLSPHTGGLSAIRRI